MAVTLWKPSFPFLGLLRQEANIPDAAELPPQSRQLYECICAIELLRKELYELLCSYPSGDTDPDEHTVEACRVADALQLSCLSAENQLGKFAALWSALRARETGFPLAPASCPLIESVSRARGLLDSLGRVAFPHGLFLTHAEGIVDTELSLQLNLDRPWDKGGEWARWRQRHDHLGWTVRLQSTQAGPLAYRAWGTEAWLRSAWRTASPRLMGPHAEEVAAQARDELNGFAEYLEKAVQARDELANGDGLAQGLPFDTQGLLSRLQGIEDTLRGFATQFAGWEMHSSPLSPLALQAQPRPSRPTAGWCLVPPSKARWEGKTDLEPRLYRLLQALLQAEDRGDMPLPFVELDGNVFAPGVSDRTIQKRVGELNERLFIIKFPTVYGVRRGHIQVL